MYLTEFFNKEQINSEFDQLVLITATKDLIQDAIGFVLDELTDNDVLESREGLYTDILNEISNSAYASYDKNTLRKINIIELLMVAESLDAKDILDMLFDDHNNKFDKLISYIKTNRLSIPSLDEPITDSDWEKIIEKYTH